jgi:hypothetical protein
MSAYLTIPFLGLLVAQASVAPEAQPSVMILAQAHDRCMTTYAVRLTRTEVADEEIFSRATEGCSQLTGQLHAAIAREYPADQARELVATIEASARPNFMTMLQRIRTDRRNRTAN